MAVAVDAFERAPRPIRGRRVPEVERSSTPAPPARACLRCGGLLSRYNSSAICSFHDLETGYNPRTDVELERRLLDLLILHFPAGVDLTLALGTRDRQGIHEGIDRLREAGYRIAGVRPSGYRLEDRRRRRRRKL